LAQAGETFDLSPRAAQNLAKLLRNWADIGAGGKTSAAEASGIGLDTPYYLRARMPRARQQPWRHDDGAQA
jgi:hypothetical protein